ncbi:hypothetical protein GF366_01800 [Candidatus Peregrinibacteria bacterium]|nr:hypothetical protein [Candidatus Peregrinibacteria bacterium]
MKKRALLILLICLSSSQLQAYSLPSIAEVQVVHPLDNSGNGFVHIRLKWEEDPGFTEGQAFEIGLMVDPKYFAIPEGGNDKRPDRYYRFMRDGNDLSCGYRDVLNYSNADSVWEAEDLIRDYCGQENLRHAGLAALIKLTSIADDVANFSVGTYCPEVDIVKDATYDIFYYLWPSSQSLLLSDSDEGFGWIVAGVMEDTCNGAVECQYLYGNVPLLGCEAQNNVWHNRICVPTDFIPFTPTEIGEGQGFGTRCFDDDEDGLFAVQDFPMFGTNVGDCDDRPGEGSYTGNDGYYENLGICFPVLESPSNGEVLPLGESYVFSWIPGGPYRHVLRIRRNPPTRPLIYGQEFDVNTVGQEIPGDFLDTSGHYHWTVCYPHNQCYEGACCAKVRTFTIEDPELPTPTCVSFVPMPGKSVESTKAATAEAAVGVPQHVSWELARPLPTPGMTATTGMSGGTIPAISGKR